MITVRIPHILCALCHFDQPLVLVASGLCANEGMDFEKFWRSAGFHARRATRCFLQA